MGASLFVPSHVGHKKPKSQANSVSGLREFTENSRYMDAAHAVNDNWDNSSVDKYINISIYCCITTTFDHAVLNPNIFYEYSVSFSGLFSRKFTSVGNYCAGNLGKSKMHMGH